MRGRHKNAQILLFVHGGPGFTSIPTSYYFMSGWDEYFTVAQYDQRGAGKTYGANDPAQVRPTMTIHRMVADAEEVAAYLRHRYRRHKIVLVGHSWGDLARDGGPVWRHRQAQSRRHTGGPGGPQQGT